MKCLTKMTSHKPAGHVSRCDCIWTLGDCVKTLSSEPSETSQISSAHFRVNSESARLPRERLLSMGTSTSLSVISIPCHVFSSSVAEEQTTPNCSRWKPQSFIIFHDLVSWLLATAQVGGSSDSSSWVQSGGRTPPASSAGVKRPRWCRASQVVSVTSRSQSFYRMTAGSAEEGEAACPLKAWALGLPEFSPWYPAGECKPEDQPSQGRETRISFWRTEQWAHTRGEAPKRDPHLGNHLPRHGPPYP